MIKAMLDGYSANRAQAMRDAGQVAPVARRTLFESDTIRIGSFVAHPLSDACGDVECQRLNAVVLPFAGLFSKYDALRRHVVGTPSHAVFIGADMPYRIGFPGAVGDRAIILRFDNALAPDKIDGLSGGETLRSHGLLGADIMMRRDLLRYRLKDPVVDRFEIETLGLELLSRCLRVLRSASSPPQSAARLRRLRAVERVREAVTVAPANPWSVSSLATIANLSPFHLCRVFRELVGTSIYDYVLRERLAQAFYAVLEGGDDITAIALDTGFSGHSHLTARFRRFFGCTPSELRRAIGPGQAGQLRKIMTAVRGDLA